MSGFLFRVVRTTVGSDRRQPVAYLCPVWESELVAAERMLRANFASEGEHITLIRSLTGTELEAHGLKRKGDWTYDPETP